MYLFEKIRDKDKKMFDELRRAYQKRVRSFPDKLEEVPKEEFNNAIADMMQSNPPKNVWRSKGFLAQLFQEGDNLRLSINRCDIDGSGKWKDAITWDELMECKRQCGYGNHWAIEVYPPDEQVVNVANIRHLWLVEQPPECAWRKNL